MLERRQVYYCRAVRWTKVTNFRLVFGVIGTGLVFLNILMILDFGEKLTRENTPGDSELSKQTTDNSFMACNCVVCSTPVRVEEKNVVHKLMRKHGHKYDDNDEGKCVHVHCVFTQEKNLDFSTKGKELNPRNNEEGSDPNLEASLAMDGFGKIRIMKNFTGKLSNVIEMNRLSIPFYLRVLRRSSKMWSLLKTYFFRSHSPKFLKKELDIVDIFTVHRKAEEKVTEEVSHLKNRKLLWHGTKTSNVPGILEHGLQISPVGVPTSGTAFGKGIYFADSSEKALEFATTEIGWGSNKFLFLCEVVLGSSAVLTRFQKLSSNFILPAGYNSVMGLGTVVPNEDGDIILNIQNNCTVPLGKLIFQQFNSSLLIFNEFVVYNPIQIVIKYVVEVRVKLL